MRRTSAALLIIFSLLTARSGSQESVSPQAYDVAEAYKIYSLLIPREPSYAFGKDRVMIRQEAVQGGMRSVSADLKGIHFSRFQGEPDGGLMSQTHTGTLAAFGD